MHSWRKLDHYFTVDFDDDDAQKEHRMKRPVRQYFASVTNLLEKFDFDSCVTNKTSNLYEVQIEV